MNNDESPKSLIDGFKLSHQMLTDCISQVQLVTRSYPLAKQKLKELYSNLLNHFTRQDHRLYDRLSLFYIDDRQATKMLEFLTHDLKDLKIRYLVFFDLHPGEMTGGHPRTFPLDFNEFAKSILARIKMEEDYLFPLLEKLPGKSVIPAES